MNEDSMKRCRRVESQILKKYGEDILPLLRSLSKDGCMVQGLPKQRSANRTSGSAWPWTTSSNPNPILAIGEQELSEMKAILKEITAWENPRALSEEIG